MKEILLFDTSEGSDNVGDEIIMDYCQKQLLEILGDMFYMNKVPTHLEIGKKTYHFNKVAEYSIVCGTNILKTSIIFNKGWNIHLKDILHLRNICLMGAGWGNYNNYNSDPYTKWAYKKIFSKNLLHSVRDSYTERRLKSIGINNVINTACPTMWRLTPDFCRDIPRTKSKSVITALTCYKQDVEKDTLMLKILLENYDKVYFWPQQSKDFEYLESLGFKEYVEIINPVISRYDKLLSTENIDFIGSRLHGGIRALNHKRRTLIVGVDNRATEINKDTNIPFIPRDNIEGLESWISGNQSTEIRLPIDNILKWKQQFNQ